MGLTQNSALLVEHWNGQQRSSGCAEPELRQRVNRSLCLAADDVSVVGTQLYTGATQYYNTLVEHYEGSRWRVALSPNFGVSSCLTGVRAIMANTVWAGRRCRRPGRVARPAQQLDEQHVQPVHCLGAGLDLRGVRPRSIGPRTQRRVAVELVAEVRHLDRRIDATNAEITIAVQSSRTTLTQLRGIGTLTAAKILARVGDVHRFRSAAAFASYTGTAPIDVSSGDVVRHRLSRAGDRQLNCCLHTMATTQIRHDGPGRSYYQRKRANGKSHKEALRCLKRRLSDTVHRRLIADAAATQVTSPGGHQGTATNSSATGSHP